MGDKYTHIHTMLMTPVICGYQLRYARAYQV